MKHCSSKCRKSEGTKRPMKDERKNIHGLKTARGGGGEGVRDRQILSNVRIALRLQRSHARALEVLWIEVIVV
jgi:hypothetical protein